jgi:4-alpha-glucanotransferase
MASRKLEGQVMKAAHRARYQAFLESPSRRQWQRIGVRRRAGVACPLFSLYSGASIGTGEIPDLALLADWCRSTGMSMIQLLPMNDVGFNFRPYDAASTFALEPMYLALGKLAGIRPAPYAREVESLRKAFPAGKERVDYGVKRAKLDLLWEIFRRDGESRGEAFESYVRKNAHWLRDYALFRVIKGKMQDACWEDWPRDLAVRDGEAVGKLAREEEEGIRFQCWLQWQLYEQFRAVRKQAADEGVLFMGDLPFLVSRDSADVWAHQQYFKLDLAAGAPPDLYIARGQRWGMPPYRWEEIARHDFDYLIQKLKYAENFYDSYRIDHFVGIFRLWTIPMSEPLENGGLNGRFDPVDEALWEDHGKRLLSVMLGATAMLPCGEDLGVVPPCSYRVLDEFSVPGMDVHRWARDWGKTYGFKSPEEYRPNSVAVLSTHDMSSVAGWWEFETGTCDAELFQRKCASRGIAFDGVKESLFDLERSLHGRLRWRKEITTPVRMLEVLGLDERNGADFADLYAGSYGEKERFWNHLGVKGPLRERSRSEFMRKVVEKVAATASVFSIQLLQDYLAIDPAWSCDPWTFRINVPGTISDTNWTLVIPVSLEALLGRKMNATLRDIHAHTGRI